MWRMAPLLVWVLVVFGSPSASAQLAWAPVVGGGAGTGAGFGDSSNRIALSAAPFGSYLYVGTYNEMTGTEVWRSSDGTSWTQANTDNFGQNLVDHINYGAYSMAAFGGYLYAGTWGGFTAADDTRVFRASDGTSWAQTNLDGFGDSDNAEPQDQVVFNGILYVGLANYPDGAEIMRTHNGANWVQANSNGFGDGNNVEVSALATDGTTLYAATVNSSTGVEVWATTTGLDWSQINSDGFGSPSNEASHAMAVFDGDLHVATVNTSSGVEVWRYLGPGFPQWIRVANGGFGDSNNVAAYAMVVHNGGLYAGTYNAAGAEVWRSQNGTLWTQVNTNGFGNASNYSVMSLVDRNGWLYAGTARSSGCEVWRVQGPIFADGFENGTTTVWAAP